MKRLKIYPEDSVTPPISQIQILLKIMVELMSALAIATKEVNEGLLSEFILIIKSISNIPLREICEETTGRKRVREDPPEAGSTQSGRGSGDSHAYS
jgi:hypothetical protein